MEGILSKAKYISAGFSWEIFSSQISTAVQKPSDEGQVATVRGRAKAETLSSNKAVVKLAIVEELGALGATVYTCCRNQGQLNQCLQQWKMKGLQVFGSVCNATSPAEKETLMNNVSSMFNAKLNILINNVGTNV
ncbi:putative tropinone reductase [Hibiscus syriacus]|uniref:Tropinone reductase n=1 Tax=Hibiscus syriacus TaxID=106335 RepID=A0A6A2Z9L1_HIBSY|nr:putative tropinone reductase [Hibiscus syriacus]